MPPCLPLSLFDAWTTSLFRGETPFPSLKSADTPPRLPSSSVLLVSARPPRNGLPCGYSPRARRPHNYRGPPGSWEGAITSMMPPVYYSSINLHCPPFECTTLAPQLTL